MRHPTRIFLASFALILCSVPGLAQKRFCPEPPPSPFKHNALIVTRFDGAADRMRTTLEHPRVLGKGSDGLYLSASFVHHQATDGSARPDVEIAFVSNSKQAVYRASHDLVILSEGRQWAFAGASAPQYYSEMDASGGVLEVTKITLGYEGLVDIIKAKKVEARLGPTQFELTHNHLEALRELASLMRPSAGAWSLR